MSRSTPSIAQLRGFAALGESLHFGDAADELGISQPSLSQSVATLEANLGVRLVERRGRTVLLTPVGQRLLPYAEQAVRAVDAVTAAARPGQWLAGSLSMGIIPTIAPYLLPTVLAALRRDAAELHLNVREDQTVRLLDALRRGRIDVAVLALPVHDPGLQQIPMYVEDFVLATPPDHPLSGRTELAADVLPRTPLLLLDEGHCLRDQALQVCGQAGAREVGDGAARSASLATIVQLVAAGMGSTLLPATAVPVESRGADLGFATFAPPVPGRTVGLVLRESSGRAEEFAQLAALITNAVCDLDIPRGIQVRTLTGAGKASTLSETEDRWPSQD